MCYWGYNNYYLHYIKYTFFINEVLEKDYKNSLIDYLSASEGIEVFNVSTTAEDISPLLKSHQMDRYQSNLIIKK